jgi:hypothetical protein
MAPQNLQAQDLAETPSGDRLITPNVGGTDFITQLSTLTRFEVTYFTALVRYPSPTGRFDRYFIDRSNTA